MGNTIFFYFFLNFIEKTTEEEELFVNKNIIMTFMLFTIIWIQIWVKREGSELFWIKSITRATWLNADFPKLYFCFSMMYDVALKLAVDYSWILLHSVYTMIRELFANSEFGESDSYLFVVLFVFMWIVKGHEFDLLKFESSLYCPATPKRHNSSKANFTVQLIL